MLEGGCNVFHQFTKKIICYIDQPYKNNNRSNVHPHNVFENIVHLSKKKTINMEVKRTSHTQKVSHIAFPQKPLVIRVNNVNKAFILALVFKNNGKEDVLLVRTTRC
jgi:hypothetical protein